MTTTNLEKIIHWAEDKAGLMRDMNANELEAIILRGIADVIAPGPTQFVELQYLVSACKTMETKMLGSGFSLPHREPANFADDVEAKLKEFMSSSSSSVYEQNNLMLCLAELLKELHTFHHGYVNAWRGFCWLRKVAARALSANYYQDKENGTYES